MKTTIDIPEHELNEVMRNTGAATKREAVVTAIAEFNRRRAAERLAAELGSFDAVMSAEELVRLRRES
jgi:Arc/MetJ family transcription regulator